MDASVLLAKGLICFLTEFSGTLRKMSCWWVWGKMLAGGSFATWGGQFLTDSYAVSKPRSQPGGKFVMVKILFYAFFPVLNEVECMTAWPSNTVHLCD